MGNRPSALTWLPLFHRTLDEEIGIAFIITGVPREQFRARLYECRRLARDPRLDELILFAPNAPHDNEIWICKKAVELEP